MNKGIFITFEGPEGCGKSTQSVLIAEHLERLGLHCVHTREPGGTGLGEKIRKLLLHSRGTRISDMAELFLFEAARAEIVDELIAPSLKAGRIVVCDRFSDATLSYQGYGGGIPLKLIRALNRISTAGLRPDLTILLDIDAAVGLKRAARKGRDRMEHKDLAYHKRIREGYLKLAGAEPSRIKVIKGTPPIKTIQKTIRREVEIVIQRHKRSG